ncbi:MAG: amidohydrolase family protein [Candidatus Dormiibacterota bacterium]
MIDSHGHPVDATGGPLDLSQISLQLAPDARTRAAQAQSGPSRLSQELLGVRLASYLGCEVEELSEARAAASQDWQAYVSKLFSDAGIEGLVLDAGWPGHGAVSAAEDEMAHLTGCSVRSILRLEPIIDQLITAGATVSEILSQVETAVRQAPGRGYVGLKTIIAYRTGLEVDPGATLNDAETSLRTTADLPTRRRGKALRDLLCRRALGWAAELGLPVQFHTGFGDSEIRLSEANPLLLDELLLTSEGGAATVVLIHGSYPWHEELAYLTTVRSNVHAEISEFNIFAAAQVADRLERILELAPGARVLCGTDGHGDPETYWFAAHLLTEAWTSVRRRWAASGAREAWLEGIEDAIFRANTARLYGF